MDRAKFAIFATLAAAGAGLLALSQPADARLFDRSAEVAAALATIRWSDDAMALAGFAVLVCSNRAVCTQ